MQQQPDSPVERISATCRELYVEKSNRLHIHDVRDVFEERGLHQMTVNAAQVDVLVAKLAIVLEDYKSDDVLTAVGILFVMVLRRFQLSLLSYLGVIQNFLFNSDDYKVGCHALEEMLGRLFKDHIVRFEQVEFKRPRKVHL